MSPPLDVLSCLMNVPSRRTFYCDPSPSGPLFWQDWKDVPYFPLQHQNTPRACHAPLRAVLLAPILIRDYWEYVPFSPPSEWNGTLGGPSTIDFDPRIDLRTRTCAHARMAFMLQRKYSSPGEHVGAALYGLRPAHACTGPRLHRPHVTHPLPHMGAGRHRRALAKTSICLPGILADCFARFTWNGHGWRF